MKKLKRLIIALKAAIKTFIKYYKSNQNKDMDHKSKIEELICEASCLSMDELYENKKNRKPEYVAPRQVHMALLKLLVGLSYQKAADPYGKDHATTIHSIKAVENSLFSNKEFRSKYKKVFDYASKENPAIDKFLPSIKKISNG